MSNCCSNNPVKNTHAACPHCNASCLHVSLKTLFQQVKFPDNMQIQAADYYFCAAIECTVGYFSATSVIHRQQLRLREEINSGWLCYCFDISEAEYRAALSVGQGAAIMDFVIQKTKAGECACESRNPSGQCCLAKFKQVTNQ
jgi:hypothetical protein